MERKLRNDCIHMAKCGLTSLSKCKQKKANLKECEGCKYVNRIEDRWKMIEGSPHKRCRRCGAYLPLDRFYPKKRKRSDGMVYEANESVCKKCRSRDYMKKKWEKLGL